MSLPAEDKQRGLFDVPVLAAELFEKATDRYRIFRETVLPALWARRGQLAELYCEDNGRPAIEPVLALAVTLLQFMEKTPDAKAVDNVRLHLGWKYALDLDIGYQGFHPTSLVKFRNRLIEGGAERVGFDALLDGLRKAGLVKNRSKQRVDSTHVLGAVARMSRLELVRAKPCVPQDTKSRQCSRLENQATGKVDYRLEWAALCDDCELQKRCTNSRNGRRMLVVGEHHQHLQQRRREMQTDEFKERMHQRNAIEGTISEFTRLGGRRTRYRGLAKTTLCN